MGLFITKISVMSFLITFFSYPQLYAAYPSMVLDGTNVKDLNDYRFSRLEAKAGDYEAETGGAEIRLTIKKKAKTFQVRRQFIAPCVNPQSKIYSNFQRSKDGVFHTRGARLRVTGDGGLLFLEFSSGVEGITNSMWTYFVPMKKIRRGYEAGRVGNRIQRLPTRTCKRISVSLGRFKAPPG